MAPQRSSDLSQIAFNANSIPDDSIDCGIRGLGWCRGATCQQYARLRTFLVVLALAGVLQGACETYFRISAKQAALEYDYDPLVVDWLLVSSGLFQVIFALAYTHWSQQFHALKWLVGTLMLQAAACVIAVIPSIMNFSAGVKQQDELLDANLCSTTLEQFQRFTLTQQQSSMLTLILLFVLQLALGMGALAYYTIGISYVDDNSTSVDSPAAIATALAARVFGWQTGSFLVLGVGLINVGWWLGWIVLAPLVFVSAVLLGLFPKRLPKTVVHQAAQRIIEESNMRQFGSRMSTYIDDTDFWPSAKRIFGNKLVMFNIVSVMFVQAAALNYVAQEQSYLQSRFFLPFNEEDGLTQEWKAAFVSYFLRPPVMAVGMLIGGLVISKMKLSARTIVSLNIGMTVHLVGIYVAYIFLKCDVGPIGGVVAGKLTQPYCSHHCLCTPTAFMPVCPENSTVTYFSPCYAGCSHKTVINSVELFDDCSCQNNFQADNAKTVRATMGACSAANCEKMLIIFQVMSLSAAAIMGVCMIGRTLVTLRTVLPQDKCMALGFEVMIVGFLAYVPAHLAYDLITRITCIYWTTNYERCLLRETPKHGDILNVLSACLTAIGLLFDILVFIYIKGLNIYNCKVTDADYTPSLYAPVPHDDPTAQASAAPSTLQTAIGGSPVTMSTTASPQQQRSTATMQPNREITVFRNPSSLTSSSAGGQSIIEPNGSGVTYAQVVFPPDKHKRNDGTASPKRLAVPANVPLHHLSEQDVRAQRGNLRSFGAGVDTVDGGATGGPGAAIELHEATPPTGETLPETTTPNNVKPETEQRPQSPETDF